MRNAAFPRRALPLVISSILCLAIGFLIGRTTSETPQENTSVIASPTPEHLLVRPSYYVNGDGSDKTGSVAGEINSPAESVAARAITAITESPGLRRINAFQSVVQNINATNWRDLHPIFRNARVSNLISAEEITWVMQRIGEVAGREAMESFKPADPVANYGIDYSGSAMKGWAIADKTAAEAYVNSLGPGKFRHGMANGFVLGIGPTDITTCRRVLATLSADEQRQTLTDALHSSDGMHFGALARAWLDTSESETPGVGMNEKSSVFNALVSQQRTLRFADFTGEKLVSWLSSFAGKPYVTAQAINAAASTRGEHNPVEALAWLESFTQSTPSLGKSAFVNVMNGFARRDVKGATEWLDAHRNSSYYGEAIVGLLNARGNEMDDTTADLWVNTITDETARTNVAKAVAARRQKGRAQ